MRKLTLLLVMVLGVSLQAGAQQFIAPTKRSTSNIDSTTTYTYKMSDNIYKVYKSRTGAYYIWKISKKTNNKMTKFTINKVIISNSKVTLFLNRSV